MTALYTVADVLAATGGRAESVSEPAISSISIDSREIEPGALFVAIRGDRFDGHDFVEAAIANGAAAAMVSEKRASALIGLPLVVVPDAFGGLADLGRFARSRTEARIVAVTGSVGKTSTKDALRAVLSTEGPTHAAVRSFNNHWGVPLTLARMPNKSAFGVFEIGMSAAGEITPLSRMVRPHIAMITAIAPAHLQNFNSLEDIARAKSEIFLGLEPDGVAIVNADHSCLDVLLAEARRAGVGRVVTYGLATDATVRVTDISSSGTGAAARVRFENDEIDLRLSAAGRHRLVNAAGVLCAARELGIDLRRVANRLSEVKETVGRGAVTRFGPAAFPLTLIDESYNANPASMASALEALASIEPSGGEKIVVLGDMLELGPTSPQLHASLKEAVLNSGAGMVYLVGPHMKALHDALGGAVSAIHAESVEDVEPLVLSALEFGDTVMVKGSLATRLGRLVARIRDRFENAESQERQ